LQTVMRQAGVNTIGEITNALLVDRRE